MDSPLQATKPVTPNKRLGPSRRLVASLMKVECMVPLLRTRAEAKKASRSRDAASHPSFWKPRRARKRRPPHRLDLTDAARQRWVSLPLRATRLRRLGGALL